MVDKRETLENFLRYQYCLIHVSPTVKGVELPAHLLRQTTVTLKVSMHFSGYVTLDEHSIVASLSFGSDSFVCTVPYGAVWACTSDLGDLVVWEEDAPHPHLVAMLRKEYEKPVSKEIGAKMTLAVSSTSTNASKDARSDRSSERPQLKRVK